MTTVVVLVAAFLALRPRGADGRPLVSAGEGFVAQNVVVPVGLGFLAAGVLWARMVYGL